ncbi:MAG: hypothetical protein ACLTZB_04115 [Streptococcus salivarius]
MGFYEWCQQYGSIWLCSNITCHDFTDILGTVIAPTTVADYLYYNTNSFNKTSVAGTDADGIVLASKNWGLKSTKYC